MTAGMTTDNPDNANDGAKNVTMATGAAVTPASINASPYAEDLRLALRMANAADAISASRFGALDLRVETKPDHTPVTDADKAVERAIRNIIARERPDDTVYGEELGRQTSHGRRWILDPIDATKNFVRGVPVWGTLIGLEIGHQITVGVVSAPTLHSRWFAARGTGAYLAENPVTGAEASGSADAWLRSARRIHVSSVNSLADASLSLSSLSGWRERGNRDALIALTDQVWRVRGFGDFWQYMLVAQGAVDAATEPDLELYDMAALVPIVTEAGGTFTDLAGNSGPWGGNALATNGLLHRRVLDALR